MSTNKAIFGESSDEDDDTPVTAPAPKKVADDDDDDDDLFGKSSDEDGDDDAPAKGDAGDAADEGDEGDAEAQAEAAALPEAIEPFQAPIVDRPSKEMKLSLCRLPKTIGIEPQPFDPNGFEEDYDSDEEEQGTNQFKRKKAKTKVAAKNVIRWRYKTDSQGRSTGEVESNARMVRWSDGSTQIFLGKEVYDVGREKFDNADGQNSLFANLTGCLQCHGMFQDKLSIRPHSMDSQAHKLLTREVTDKFKNDRRIKIHVGAGDPALEKKRMEEEEAMLIREREMMERKQRKELMGQKGGRASFNPSSDYLEDGQGGDDADDLDDEDDHAPRDMGGGDAERRRMEMTKKRAAEQDDDDDDDDDDEAEFDNVGSKNKKRRAMIDDDDDLLDDDE